MIYALASGGKLILVQASGNDSGSEIIQKIWPKDNPFPSLANDIITCLKDTLDEDILNKIILQQPETFRYDLRALPNEIDNGIGTSLIFSSWNAATYVSQVNNENIMKAEQDGRYVRYVQETIKKYGGLWFNDELLIIEHKK